MKRNIYAIAMLVSILVAACTQEVVKNQTENYTPPVLKEQPKFFYPTLAQEQFVFGKTKVVLKISREGNVYGVVVTKSAGNEILDRAVVDYCKTLSFKAATKDGDPIESRYVWEFNFDFADQKYNIRRYLEQINDLVELANRAVSNERTAILQDILKVHNEFIESTDDALNFNGVVEKIISRDLAAEWKKDWDSYPLSFLIYHDFMQKFSNFDSIASVKLLLRTSVQNDLKYINSIKTTNMDSQIKKNILLEKIQKFIKDKYPDLATYKDDILLVGM